MKTATKIEFGDFQTPVPLAGEVCALLSRKGINADVVVEPTCGAGTFLIAAAAAFPKASLLGWDVNGAYVEEARLALKRSSAGGRATVQTQDFFTHDWEKEFAGHKGSLLVLGNLPWVTNATISGLNGTNVPIKENFQGFRGMAARTGKSNFDISEWMLIQLVKALRGRSATIAMLCKTAIARKLLRFAWQNDGRIAASSLHRIDAKQHFGASVDACLFLAHTGEVGPMEAPVFDDLDSEKASQTLGLAGQDLVADVRTYRRLRHLEGLCPYQWRSGVKHDCVSVMELWPNEDGSYRNKLDEHVQLEPEHLFPFLKCSDLANHRTTSERVVLVTQRRVGEDTATIAASAPKTWRYLNSHLALFKARKSSIYVGRMPFALFGIGDYTFAPWKVAVSGLHRTVHFALIGPTEGKPVLFDDTCYFLSFESEDEAKVVAAVLNSTPCALFLSSLLFPDSKRPVTVELLQRLNIHAIADEAGLGREWASARTQRVTDHYEMANRQAEFVMERPHTK